MKKSILIFAVIVVALVGLYFVNTNDQATTETASDTNLTESESTNETNVTPNEEDPDMTEPESEATDGVEPELDDTNTEEAAAVKVFNLTGKNFSFSENEIRVQKGDTVTINFESTDGFHDWVVDEFNAATKQVRPAAPTSVTFVADTTGSFEYYCSVGNHRAQGMVGQLIVE